jgi:hypothetical protein
MAMRTKTIEYAFPTLTTQLNAGSRNDFAAITLYIPETTSRKFLSVTAEVRCHENEAAGGTGIGARTIGVKLGAAAFSDLTRTDAFSQTYLPSNYRFLRDVTAYFVSNFGSGTSQTCQLGFQLNTQDVHGVTMKLYITYEYDDEGQATKVKTVRIPLESNPAALTATLAEIGTNQVPQLTSGGLLPEASITIRDMWFEVWLTDASDNTTDHALELSLDGEAGVSFGTWEMGQGTRTRRLFVVWKRADMSPTAAHAFKARSTTANRFYALNVDLMVAYEYDEATTTTVLTSCVLDMPQVATVGYPNDALTDAYRSQLKFLVEEASVVTLKQSAIRVQFNSMSFSTDPVIQVRAGSQSVRGYTVSAAISYDGNAVLGLQHRIDSGGAQGAGLSLVRGENTVTLDAYQSSTSASHVFFNMYATVVLNYTAAKHEHGSCAHHHTTHWILKDSESTSATSNVPLTWTFNPLLAESLYWVTAAGIELAAVNAGVEDTVHIMAEAGPDERYGAGWVSLAQTSGASSEMALWQTSVGVSEFFKRHPLDPDSTRMNLGRSRSWRMGGAGQGVNSDIIYAAEMRVSYHSLPTWVERGVTPAVASLPVKVHRADTDSPLYTPATISTGSFLFPCFTTSLSHYAQAYRNNISAGRSFDFTPSGFAFNVKWLPTYMTGLGFWFRADKEVTQSGTVSAWGDQSANNNDAAQGTAGNRPTYLTNGGDGKPALSFDGSTDLLEVTDHASFGSTTAFSVSCWIRTGTTFPTDGTIIAHWGATERFLMRVETGGNLVVSVSNGTVGSATLTGVLTANTWYHLAFSYLGAGSTNADKLKVYINGVLQSPTYSGTLPSSVGNPTSILSIGSRNAASTYFNGYIGDILFVDSRVMTEEEILMHYHYRPRFG